MKLSLKKAEDQLNAAERLLGKLEARSAGRSRTTPRRADKSYTRLLARGRFIAHLPSLPEDQRQGAAQWTSFGVEFDLRRFMSTERDVTWKAEGLPGRLSMEMQLSSSTRAGSPNNRSIDTGEPVAQGARRQGRKVSIGGCHHAASAVTSLSSLFAWQTLIMRRLVNPSRFYNVIGKISSGRTASWSRSETRRWITTSRSGCTW